jgi:putative transport protein
MSWITQSLRAHPELALFLVLGLGHAIGRIRLGPLRLNPVIGVLLTGVAIGQIGIEVPPALQWSFFVLFLFSVGYRTGPQFFQGLGRGALPQAGLALLFCATGLAATYAFSRLLGFSAGAAAGLIAGGLNASAALGTAGDAISKLPVSAVVRNELTTSSAVAFAVTYLAGLLTSIVMLSKIGPWLMRIDLKSECRKLETALGMDQREPGVFSAYQKFAARAYSLPASFDGRTVEALEQAFAPERAFAERIRTSDGVLDAGPEAMLHTGDTVVLTARRDLLASPANPLLQNEIDDPELLDIPVITIEHLLARRDLQGRSLAVVAETVAREVPTRGVFLRGVTRASRDLPVGPGLVLQQGDTLRLVGARRHVERVAAQLGKVAWPSSTADMAVLGVSIAAGGLIGVPALRVAGVDIGLSTPVGVLLGGLVAGWMHARRPTFGRVPDAALALLDSLGLSAFLALVGIGAGPGFIQGLRTSGLPLLAAGVTVCAVPNLVTICVGRFLLGLHPGILLGICAGGGTAPAALAALQDAAGSQVPTLGYGVSYAVGSILLAFCGSVIVVLMGVPG